MSDTLVPEPQASIFDSVTKALGNDEDAARRVMLNPNLAKGFKDGKPVNKESKKDGQDICASTSSTLVWFTASKSTNWAEPSSR